MDYEKKYKEALERAKGKIKEVGDNEGRKRIIRDIFPELRECDDERIKEKILRKMRACQKESNFFDDEELSWLEKQGEN